MVHAPGGGTVLPQRSVAGEIDDCAALLRYAYREALRQHDVGVGQGRSRCRLRPQPTKFGNINIPTLRSALELFRVREGSFAGQTT